MIYLEKLYFEKAIEKKGGEYKEKLDDTTKDNINKYYKGKSGQLITKDKLSLTIIRFILNNLMNQRNDKTKNRLFEMDDNLFDTLSNKSLWEESIYKEPYTITEIAKYCIEPKTKLEIYNHFFDAAKKDYCYIYSKYIEPLVYNGILEYLYPDHPKSKYQKIKTSEKTLEVLFDI